MENVISTEAVNNFVTFCSVVIFLLEWLDVKFMQQDYVGVCHKLFNICSERDASLCHLCVCQQLQENQQITVKAHSDSRSGTSVCL
jgi:hypothetical protein